MAKTVAEWIAAGLVERKVEWISALCGHGLDPLFDAAHRAGLRIIDTRNEQTAGYVAGFWGRLTRRPGVCASSSGVAVANLLTGAMDAWFDGSPMLCLSGSAALPTLGLGAFQDSPQVELAGPVTRMSRMLDTPRRALHLLDQAWRAAESGPGPVHLMLPMDVQSAKVEEADLVRPAPPAASPGCSIEAVQAVANQLLRARKPLIVAGSGVWYADEGRDLRAFAEHFAIPVQTPIWDRGVFDEESPVWCGVVGAATGGPDLLSMSDCVIVAGAAVDYRTGYLQGRAPAVQLTRGWRELDRELTVAGESHAEWLAEARELRAAYSRRIAETGERQRGAAPMHSVDVVRAIESAMPADGTLIIDGGSIGQWAHQLVCDRRYPGYWLTCGRSGVVGYGLAGAMAARLARPDKAVVLLSGDGAFTFTLGEIECAVRQRLPFVAVVADDQCWGITHSGHLRQFGGGIGTRLGPIAFDRLAESMGARGARAENRADLEAAIRTGIESGEPTVIHAPVPGGNPV